MITKHYYKSIVRAALLLAVTMCITGLAPTFSTSAMAFDLGTLNGAYGGNNSNWVTGSGNGNGSKYFPNSARQLITFDGAGHLTIDQANNDFGTLIRWTVPGTYTVNADGTGQMSWIGPNGGFHLRDFVIVNGGAQIMSMNSNDFGESSVIGIGAFIKQLGTTFGLGTLNGTYGGNNLVWVTVSGNANPAVHPISSRELITFDGAGHLTNDQLIDDAGTIVRQTVTSTYTVNSNGTGQMSWTDPQGVFHMRDFVIVNASAQLNSIDDPDGGALAGVGTFIKQ